MPRSWLKVAPLATVKAPADGVAASSTELSVSPVAVVRAEEQVVEQRRDRPRQRLALMSILALPRACSRRTGCRRRAALGRRRSRPRHPADGRSASESGWSPAASRRGRRRQDRLGHGSELLEDGGHDLRQPSFERVPGLDGLADGGVHEAIADQRGDDLGARMRGRRRAPARLEVSVIGFLGIGLLWNQDLDRHDDQGLAVEVALEASGCGRRSSTCAPSRRGSGRRAGSVGSTNSAFTAARMALLVCAGWRHRPCRPDGRSASWRPAW